MIKLDHEQGTPEWFAARIGLPSASNFKKIITSTGKASTSASTYMLDLLSELVTGAKTEGATNEWMQRGIELEYDAVGLYEMLYDVDTEESGFILHNSRRFGCSPDRLIGKDGGLEIKCPKPSTHMKYLLGGKCPTEYYPQVMGCMLVTDAKWWDFMSYHPEIKPLIVRVQRNDEYINKMRLQVFQFCDKLDEKLNQYKSIEDK